MPPNDYFLNKQINKNKHNDLTWTRDQDEYNELQWEFRMDAEILETAKQVRIQNFYYKSKNGKQIFVHVNVHVHVFCICLCTCSRCCSCSHSCSCRFTWTCTVYMYMKSTKKNTKITDLKKFLTYSHTVYRFIFMFLLCTYVHLDT